jgi:flagellar basal-body rod protein FlgB
VILFEFSTREVWNQNCSLQVAVLDKVGTSLERYMDLLAMRQKVVAANIANAETPGYRAKDLRFSRELEGALSSSAPAVVEVDSLPAKSDGNTVDLDRELRLLSENALRFQVASGLLRTELQAVRLAIQEGKAG